MSAAVQVLRATITIQKGAMVRVWAEPDSGHDLADAFEAEVVGMTPEGVTVCLTGQARSGQMMTVPWARFLLNASNYTVEVE